MQLNIRFSQGGLATYFRCIGRSYTIFICNSSENATVKELLTSVHICERRVMRHNNACPVFLRHSVDKCQSLYRGRLRIQFIHSQQQPNRNNYKQSAPLKSSYNTTNTFVTQNWIKYIYCSCLQNNFISHPNINHCETTNMMKVSSGDGVLQRKNPLFLFIGIFSCTKMQMPVKIPVQIWHNISQIKHQ